MTDSHAALEYDTKFCCDRHDDKDWNIANFLPGPMFHNVLNAAVKRKVPPARSKTRPVKQRLALDNQLIEWLMVSVKSSNRAGCDILSDQNRGLLVRASCNSLRSPADITKLLDETAEWEEDWAASLLQVISKYDMAVNSHSKAPIRKRVKTSVRN
jgi:hypothetical protein